MTERVARRSIDGTVLEWLDVPARAAALALEPHPEGGWYRRTWTSPVTVETGAGARPGATLILFLLPPGEASAWHTISSDEIWLWHGPDPVTLELGGTAAAPTTERTLVLGPAAGQGVQAHVPARTWQRTLPEAGECLVSCVVSPGFDFADFAQC